MKSTTPQIIMNSQYILHYDVTQPTNWPTDQPTSISFTMMLHNQLTDQPTNQYILHNDITQPTDWPANQPTNQSNK